MHSHRLEDTDVLKPMALVAFLLVDLVMLVGMLAVGPMSFAALSTDPGPFRSSLLSTGEVFRALAGSVGFMTLSGYLVSVSVLTVIFRNRLLSRTRASSLALLFAAHAIFFLFYLRGPAAPAMSVLLIAIGVVCVIAVTMLENVFWRRWWPCLP